MNVKIFTIKVLLIIFLLTSCSFYNNKSCYSNIDELYLNLNKFKKNYKNMTREQIIYIFGDPIISDSFSDTYHYIFYKKLNIHIYQKKMLNIFFKKDKVYYFTIEILD